MEAEIGPEKERGRKSGKKLTKGVQERRKSAAEMDYVCHPQIYVSAFGEASGKANKMSGASYFLGCSSEFANQWLRACGCASTFLCPKRKANKNPRPRSLSLIQFTRIVLGFLIFSSDPTKPVGIQLDRGPWIWNYLVELALGGEVEVYRWRKHLHRITDRISYKLGTKSQFLISPCRSIHAIMLPPSRTDWTSQNVFVSWMFTLRDSVVSYWK